MGIIGMKVAGARAASFDVDTPSIEAQKHSWKAMAISDGQARTLTMREAMYYTLSRPVSTVIIGLRLQLPRTRRERAIGAGLHARSTISRQTELVARAEACAKPSLFFRFMIGRTTREMAGLVRLAELAGLAHWRAGVRRPLRGPWRVRRLLVHLQQAQVSIKGDQAFLASDRGGSASS